MGILDIFAQYMKGSRESPGRGNPIPATRQYPASIIIEAGTALNGAMRPFYCIAIKAQKSIQFRGLTNKAHVNANSMQSRDRILMFRFEISRGSVKFSRTITKLGEAHKHTQQPNTTVAGLQRAPASCGSDIS